MDQVAYKNLIADKELEERVDASIAEFQSALDNLEKSETRTHHKQRRQRVEITPIRFDRAEILQKTSELVKAGEMSLLTAGIIERRLNRGEQLSSDMIRALDLDPEVLKKSIENERAIAADVKQKMSALSPQRMQPGDRYSFQSTKSGNVVTVSKSDILRAVRKAVRAGTCDLREAGVIESRVNKNVKIDASTLRALFED